MKNHLALIICLILLPVLFTGCTDKSETVASVSVVSAVPESSDSKDVVEAPEKVNKEESDQLISDKEEEPPEPSVTIDYVEITPDNFWDYFEWDQAFTLNISYNTFNEPEQIWACKYLKLQDRYSDTFLKEESTIAIEFEHEEKHHKVYLTYDASTGSYVCAIQESAEHFDSGTVTNIVEDIYTDTTEDDKTIYYLTSWNASIISPKKEGDLYTEGPKPNDRGYLENLRVKRSNTTLAFKR